MNCWVSIFWLLSIHRCWHSSFSSLLFWLLLPALRLTLFLRHFVLFLFYFILFFSLLCSFVCANSVLLHPPRSNFFFAAAAAASSLYFLLHVPPHQPACCCWHRLAPHFLRIDKSWRTEGCQAGGGSDGGSGSSKINQIIVTMLRISNTRCSSGGSGGGDANDEWDVDCGALGKNLEDESWGLRLMEQLALGKACGRGGQLKNWFKELRLHRYPSTQLRVCSSFSSAFSLLLLALFSTWVHVSCLVTKNTRDLLLEETRKTQFLTNSMDLPSQYQETTEIQWVFKDERPLESKKNHWNNRYSWREQDPMTRKRLSKIKQRLLG